MPSSPCCSCSWTPFPQQVMLCTSEGQDPFPWVLCSWERGSETTGIPARVGGYNVLKCPSDPGLRTSSCGRCPGKERQAAEQDRQPGMLPVVECLTAWGSPRHLGLEEMSTAPVVSHGTSKGTAEREVTQHRQTPQGSRNMCLSQPQRVDTVSAGLCKV